MLPFLSRSEPPRRMAILGNAAGTTARAYGRLFPSTRIDGVELDSELSEIGRRYFDMRNPRLTMHHEDARPFLRRVDTKYDVIEVDAYRQPYIPFYLTTEEFFALVRDRLTPDGVVIINVGQPEGETKLERVLTGGLRTAFAHVVRDPIQDTNTLLVAGRSPLSAARLRAAIPAHAARPAPPRRAGGGGRVGAAAARPSTPTPTTARRSSGWWTSRSWTTRPTTTEAVRSALGARRLPAANPQ